MGRDGKVSDVYSLTSRASLWASTQSPRWCRGGAENVVWDAFFPTPGDVEVGVEDVVWDVFFSSQGRVEVAQRMSSGTRFPSTLFNSLQPHFNPSHPGRVEVAWQM